MDVLESFKAAQKAGWAHFAPLQALTTFAAPRLVRHARVPPGSRLLDVGCGTGVVAVTAARAGARVTGLDLTPELLQAARENCRVAAVDIEWHEADVENMPFGAATFDVVVSQFGHIFAPRPDVAVSEMLRVLKPGGTIAFSTWPPELFVGRLFALVGRYMPPPPPGVVPPSLWGEPSIIRERLCDAFRGVMFRRATIVTPALSLSHHREMTERTAGPLLNLVESRNDADP